MHQPQYASNKSEANSQAVRLMHGGEHFGEEPGVSEGRIRRFGPDLDGLWEVIA
jgi:hypothetical protein